MLINYSFEFGKYSAQMSDQEFFIHRTLINSDCLKNKLSEFIADNEIDTKLRKREVVYLRSILYHFLRRKGMSFNEIGKRLKKDHATVIHGIKVYEILTQTKDKEFLQIKNQWSIYFDNLIID